MARTAVVSSTLEQKFTVGRPTNEVPKVSKTSQYEDIFKQVGDLAEGAYLPVTMADNNGALSLQRAAKERGFEAEKRQLTIFISAGKNGQ